MATIMGHLGNFSFSGGTASQTQHIANVYEWQMTIRRDVYKSTVFGGNADAHTKHIGMYTIEGVLNGFFDYVAGGATVFTPSTAMLANRSGRTIVLTSTTGKTFTFPFVFFNWNVTTNKQTGLVSFTGIRFKNQGAFTGIL